jgi:hypothetical protein
MTRARATGSGASWQQTPSSCTTVPAVSSTGPTRFWHRLRWNRLSCHPSRRGGQDDVDRTMWTGNTDAPLYEAARRVVLERATGVCERGGRTGKLTVHHIHRGGGSTPDKADNRPEMMQALCSACQAQEHRAEHIYRAKSRPRTAAGHWVKMRGKPGAGSLARRVWGGGCGNVRPVKDEYAPCPYPTKSDEDYVQFTNSDGWPGRKDSNRQPSAPESSVSPK